MKAFTIYPWFGFAFTKLGKNVENRGWQPSPRQLAHSEWVAIHSGVRKLRGGRHRDMGDLIDLIKDARTAGWEVDILGFDHLVFKRGDERVTYLDGKVQRSAVMAVAQYNGATAGVDMPWRHPGNHQWRFSSVIPLPRPIPIRGQQGLWELPGRILQYMVGQVPGAVLGGA